MTPTFRQRLRSLLAAKSLAAKFLAAKFLAAGRGVAARLSAQPVWWVTLLALPLWGAFPPLDWPLLGWVALAPLVWALRRGPGSALDWFGAGLGLGALYALLQYDWLPRAVVTLGGRSWITLLELLVILAGLYGGVFALAVGGARRLWLRRRWHPGLTLPVLLAAQDAALGVFPFGGMGWGSLAAPQVRTFAAHWVAPLLGGPGVVLLLGLCAAAWAWVLQLLASQPLLSGQPGGRGRVLGGLSLVALLTALAAWPMPLLSPAQLSAARSAAPGSIPPVAGFYALPVPGDLSLSEQTSADAPAFTLSYYLGRTLVGIDSLPAPQGAQARPRRLVVWPESALRGNLEGGKGLAQLSTLGSLLGVDFLLGGDAFGAGATPDAGSPPAVHYNAAYLVTGGPPSFRRYDKRTLVPFGEAVPSGLGLLVGSSLVGGPTGYGAGGAPPVLAWGDIVLGIAICSESLLPGHARSAVRHGAQAIVAPTNGLWLTPAAQQRLLQLSALRGLEVGRDVLFVSNGAGAALLREGQVVASERAGAQPRAVWVRLRSDLTPWVRAGYLWLLLAAVSLLAGAAYLARGPIRG